MTWHEELRARYRPAAVRLLLIGESPPDPGDSGGRFFYAPTLSRHDNLYRGVTALLYDDDVDVRNKPATLERLRADGVWLIDAVDEPVNQLTRSERRRHVRGGLPHLLAMCQDLQPRVGVLICHAGTFDVCARPLRDAGVNVLHDRSLHFPDGFGRAQFVTNGRAALAAAGWWTG